MNKIKVKFYTPIINYPDTQTRIFRNSKNIRWIGRVHERITGFKEFTVLPEMEEFSIYHPKTIAKQEKQNAYYDTL